MKSIPELIELSKEARETHVLWKDYNQKRIDKGEESIPHTGDPDHHKKWIEYYDEIIQVLNNLTISK